MTTTLASRLFVVANKAGMMNKEFSWLVTDGLSNFVDSMDPVALDSVKGVIGIMPYVPKTKALVSFKTRYKRVSKMKGNNESSELNIFGLRVYDTIWALAMTVERIGTVNSGVLKETKGRTSAEETDPRRILEEILRHSFRGISGDLHLVNGLLQPSAFEIFNLTGKGVIRMIGYWTADQGISQNSGSARTRNSTSRNKLKKTIIPGDTRKILKADDMPTIGKKWRIGVPGKTGFTEFVNIHPGNKVDDDELPGFSIDVFQAVWKALALPHLTDYEFVPLDEAYDEICCQVKNRTIDVAVGDISIVASRINCVDFTLPYLETGDHAYKRIVVRILDRHENTELVNGSRRKQISRILMLPCLSVAIPQGTSYTANLSSILTVNQLKPTIPSFKELRTRYVGYQNLSFVKDFLINQLEFKEYMLKPYASVDDYWLHDGGVDAIFDEIPYIKRFLA
ncbi:hypothetical protein REPUB_Repub18cG0044800 [Reevesia pubescens]